MNWFNPDDFIKNHLLIVTVLAGAAILLAIILLLAIFIKRHQQRFKYLIPLMQKVLYNTKFTYTVMKRAEGYYLVKVSYLTFPYKINYYLSVKNTGNYLLEAKKMIKQLIDDKTLCVYTLKHFVTKKEFMDYATR